MGSVESADIQCLQIILKLIVLVNQHTCTGMIVDTKLNWKHDGENVSSELEGGGGGGGGKTKTTKSVVQQQILI